MAIKKNVATKTVAQKQEIAKKPTPILTGMKAKLAACKKVTIKVPVNPLNPKDLDVVVQINGYVYQIKRGVMVEVPAPVAKLLERAKYI